MTLLAEHPAPPKPLRFTRDEYHRLGETGLLADRRVELIEGVIIEMSPVGRKHWVTTNLVAEKLEQIFADGFFVSVQSPIYLPASEPGPDVAVFRGSPRDYTDIHSFAIPELVVEVADSSLDFDRTQKSEVYARASVAEYWIVDPNRVSVELRRTPDASSGLYASQRTLRRGETIAPLSMPDAEISVDDLLP